MAHERFDDLSRAVASATSRRHVIKVIAGTVIGAFLGVRATRDTDAAPPDPAPPPRSPSGGGLPGVTIPVPRGGTNCNGVIVDTATDPRNCGSCGHVCTPGQACAGGACVANCPGGQTNCGGRCLSLASDNNNCGTCGVACGAGRICANGTCVAGCPHGMTLCGGACKDVMTDAQNCGACGVTCQSGQTCIGGYCGGVGAPCGSQSPCAAGTYCAPVTAGAANGVCTPRSAKYCASCTQNSDCGSHGEACAQLGPDTAPACHIDCSLAGAAACPPDYVCTSQTVASQPRMLCRPKLALPCPNALGGYCTSGVSSPQSCSQTNIAGICTGQRVCLSTGPNAGRYDVCGAQAPQCLTDCSQQPPAGCTESYCAGATSTPMNCGACGNVCPGYQQQNDNVTCNVSQTCTFSCQGEHYDLNNDPSDGCEQVDTTTGNHTQATAVSLGSKSCFDTPTSSFTGLILSDRRVHESPAIVGFDAISGSAPDWYFVTATGGATCQNDVVATITTTGGSNVGQCYKITIITDKNFIYSTTVSGNGSASINHTTGQYSDGSTVYFKIEKTCSTSVIEAVNYTVVYHL